jgi:Leucine-rich repeat (LRR) protein
MGFDVLSPDEIFVVASIHARLFGPTCLMSTLGAVSRAMRVVSIAVFNADRRGWLIAASISDVRLMSTLKGIKRLDVSRMHADQLHIPTTVAHLQVGDLASLQTGVRLTSVLAKQCSSMPVMHHLQRLSVAHCGLLTDISPIAALDALRYVSLRECWSLRDLDPLRALTRLVSLEVTFSRVREIPVLGTSLRTLRIRGCRWIESIEPIMHLTSLTELDLSMCNRITHAHHIGALTNLTSLDVSFGSRSLVSWGIARDLLTT